MSVFAEGIDHETQYGDYCSQGRTDEQLTEIARDIVQGKAFLYSVEEKAFEHAAVMLLLFLDKDSKAVCPIHTGAFVGTSYNPHSYAINGTPMFTAGHFLTWEEWQRLDEIVRPMYAALGVTFE